MEILYRLTGWWNFYKMIRVMKKMVREQENQATRRQLDSAVEYMWTKAGMRFVVKKYKGGHAFYQITTTRGEPLFEAMDKGWLAGTSGVMENGMTPDVLIMKMLS